MSDLAQIQSYVTARQQVPAGVYHLDGATDQIDLTQGGLLWGEGVQLSSVTPGPIGTVLSIENATASPLKVGRGSTLRGVNVVYPGQVGSAAGPVAFPPTITDDGQQTSNITVEDCCFVGAYDWWTQTTKNPYGNIKITNSDVYAVRRVLSLTCVAEAIAIAGMICNPSRLYGVLQDPNRYLLNWTLANGVWLYVFGTGTPAQGDLAPVGGIEATNLTVVCYRRGVHVDTGSLDEASFSGVFDTCPTVLEVTPNGGITRGEFNGKYYAFSDPSGLVPTPAFYLNNPALGVSGGSDLRVSGALAGGDGDFFVVEGTNVLGADLIDADVVNPGQVASHPAYGAFINAPNAAVAIQGGRWQAANANMNSVGVALVAARTATVTGCNFDNWGKAIGIGGNTGSWSVTGNTSSRTVGPRSADPGGGNLVYSGNEWDKP